MRIAFIGVSHWHTHLYLDPVLAIPDVIVAGVSDADPEIARRYGERLGCRWFDDYRELRDQIGPDFAFVLGPHSTMAEACGYLIQTGIPFCVEKPAGTSHAQLAELARAAKARGHFAAVPFVFRGSDFLAEVERSLAGGSFHYLHFKFVAGPVSRYQASNSSWMLDKTIAGGGCFINLGVHFVDLARHFLGDDLAVDAVSMSTMTGRHDVEDHAVVILSKGAARCVIETGYLYPAPPGVFDMHFSLASRDRYFVVRDPSAMDVIEQDGAVRRVELATTNVPYYPSFTADVLDRFRKGAPPLASLADMAAVMELVDEAFGRAGRLA